MKDYIGIKPWSIVEEGFHPEYNKVSESIFSIGNGRMGQRANFEEEFSGSTLSGSYIAGVYYPDKTRVGWWKNGYPEYFAKVLNAVKWNGIELQVDGQTIDLAKMKPQQFYRELNMKTGLLSRRFKVELPNGNILEIHASRFCSMKRKNLGAIRYEIKTSKDCSIQLISETRIPTTMSSFGKTQQRVY
jgi:maltose phosphorylase